MNNIAVPALLRAIASGSVAKANKHDIIFTAAADEIDRLRREVEYLRHYGNKDCTAMADAAMDECALEQQS